LPNPRSKPSQYWFHEKDKSNLEEGRKDGPRPVDVDQIDLHQVFMDINIPISNEAVFSPPSLPLEPAFENIGPETPMRPSIPDPKRARYCAFNRVAAQGSRSDAK
jgi:hypothetical protein